MIGLVLAATLVACGGSSDKDSDKDSAKSNEADCSKDYVDPSKELCVEIPSRFKFTPERAVTKPDNSEYWFTDAPTGTAMYLRIGNVSYPSYEELLAADEDILTKSDVESSGKLKADGKWWLFTDTDGNQHIHAMVKGADGVALLCTSEGRPVKADAIKACKTLRPFKE